MKTPLIKFKEHAKDHRNKEIFHVYNHEDEFLGVINNSHVGRFFHWVFCPQEQTYFTNGCLKEISGFITKLYGKKNEQK